MTWFLKTGKKITVFPIRLIYLTEKGSSEVKAGFTVSSKTFPRAVDRNRIKRLCRESFRLQKNELISCAEKNESGIHLFFIYTAREILSFDEIRNRLKQVLDKLIKIWNEEIPANS